ncbi:MAG: protein kinase, partial [Myxococcales bacterium]|nr:protein kinase [Myxococcales bacterium]
MEQGQLPTDLAGYQITGVLGEGGVGVVYAALRDGREVALKVASPGTTGVRRDWMRREASLAARLRHPHIVELLHAGELPDGRPFLVLERVVGASLDVRADALSSREIMRLGAELLDALTYAHDAGILHLDISPGNVLLRADGAAMLTDFGLAAPRDGRGGLATFVAGTPGYLSPEQALGSGVGPRSDLFGVGALLYRLIAGFPPHGGTDSTEALHRTLHGDALPLRPRAGLTFHPDALALVTRLISRDPELRPPSAAAARAAWAAAVAQTPPPPRFDPHLPTPLAPLSRPSLVATLHSAGAGPTAPISAPEVDERTEVASAPDASRPAFASAAASTPRPSHVALADALAAQLPPAAGGSVRWLVGPPGSGRSSVLDALVAALHRVDAQVVRVTGRRGAASPPLEAIAAVVVGLANADVGPPFAVAERLTHELERRLERPPGTSRVLFEDDLRLGRDALVDGVLGTGRATDVGGARLQIFRAIQRLRAPGRPLVLLVDDADALDPASLAILESLAADVGVVLTSTEPRSGALSLPDLGRGARTCADLALVCEDEELDLARCDDATLDALVARADAVLDALSQDELALLAVVALFDGDAPRRGVASIASAAAGRLLTTEQVDGLVKAGLLRPVERPIARAERWVRLAA